jgi:hypothetical protein
MATNLPVKLIPVQLGTGYCPATYQQFNEDILKAEAYVELGTVSFFIANPTAPDETVYPEVIWVKTDGNNAPVRFYRWSSNLGFWISPHPVPANSPEMRIWNGIASDVAQYEGDERSSLPLNDEGTDGPFWAIVAEMTGRVPIGVNSAAQSGSPPPDATLPAIEQGLPNTSVGEVTLGFTNLPIHTHYLGWFAGSDDNVRMIFRTDPVSVDKWGLTEIQAKLVSGEAGGDVVQISSLDVLTTDADAEVTSDREVSPVPTMPPGIGVYYIARTIRVYYATP